MSQYRTGTVTVISGSNVVLGQGTSWTSSNLITAGNTSLFNIIGSNRAYEIASVTSTARLTLTTSFVGVSAVRVAYAITKDFTPNHDLPFFEPGDDTSAVLGKLVQKLDAIIPASGTTNNVTLQGPAGTTTYQHFAYSNDENGSGFSSSPTSNSRFLGIAQTLSIDFPAQYTDFVWVRIRLN